MREGRRRSANGEGEYFDIGVLAGGAGGGGGGITAAGFPFGCSVLRFSNISKVFGRCRFGVGKAMRLWLLDETGRGYVANHVFVCLP